MMKTQFNLIKKDKTVVRELEVTLKGDKEFLEELKRRIEAIGEMEDIKML